MHLRKSFACIFLLVFLFFGTGVYFLAGTFLIRAHSSHLSAEEVKGSENFAVLQIPESAFKLLEKEKIGEHTYEITWQGVRYDVYSGSVINKMVILSAVSDKNEMSFFSFFNKNTNENNPDHKQNISALSFTFYFVESIDKISFDHDTPGRFFFKTAFFFPFVTGFFPIPVNLPARRFPHSLPDAA